MRKQRGWSQMTADKKMEALKADLDQLYNMVTAHEKTLKELIEHIDRNFRQLGGDISSLQQALSRG